MTDSATSDSAAHLARLWLRAWDTHDLSLLRLAPDFVHTSPFGRIEGAEEYLRIVEPMSRRSVQGITVHDVIEDGARAAVTYEVHTTAGTVRACDWVFVRAGEIVRVDAYYDSVTNRAALDAGGPVEPYPDAPPEGSP